MATPPLPRARKRQCSTGYLALAGALLVATATGCQKKQPPADAAGPPVAPVSHPSKRPVRDYVDYTGRTAAVDALDVRARVTGYLVDISFTEGGEVKKGQGLFKIDPQPYQAAFDAAKAQVAVYEANYRLAKANNARSKYIAAKDSSAISPQDLETAAATEAQGYANLGVARANLRTAQLNLDFTKVTSSIDGQASRTFLTTGNLVNADQTLLTTVVSLNPIYVYFDMDERTILRIRKAINEGVIVPPKNTEEIPVLIGLEDEPDKFPHTGTLNFVNNAVNPSTGTITVRGKFDNPKPTNGRRLLSPGMFVRVRIFIGQEKEALLLADRAIGSDQGLKFVYVVDADHKVQYRRVTTGALQPDGLRVVAGLKPGDLKETDWVVIGALQSVRPRMVVEPVPTDMPLIPTAEGGQAPPPVPHRPQPPPGGRGSAGTQPSPTRPNPNKR